MTIKNTLIRNQSVQCLQLRLSLQWTARNGCCLLTSFHTLGVSLPGHLKSKRPLNSELVFLISERKKSIIARFHHLETMKPTQIEIVLGCLLSEPGSDGAQSVPQEDLGTSCAAKQSHNHSEANTL
jgi:hypothetical protein